MKKIFFTFLILLILPVTAFAQAFKFTGLVQLPNATFGDIGSFVNTLYATAIALAALIAVLKIIVSGAKYMLTESTSGKGSAKEEIKGALLGLLLILSAVVILNLINPNLTDLRFVFKDPPKRPDVVGKITGTTINGATPDEFVQKLLEGANPCAKGDSPIGKSGLKVVAMVDTSSCTTADKPEEIFKNFQTRCKAEGGIAKEYGENKMACTKLLDVIKPVEKYAVNEYSSNTNSKCLLPGIDFTGILCASVRLDGDEKYLQKEGTIVTYNAELFCKEKYPELGLTNCKEEVKDAFTDSDDKTARGFLESSYCPNNAGKTLGDFKCQLPIKTFSTDEASAFSKTAIKEVEDYKIACEDYFKEKNLKGELVDTKRTGAVGTSDYMCVVY